MKDKGLVQIYTGNGKGKTTAAVGLAVRARGHNLRVCYIYFHKDSKRWNYGEHKILEKIGVSVFGFAKKHPHFYKDVKRGDISKECAKGLRFIKKIYREGRYDMLILDEINISVRDGFLNEDEVIDIVNRKPERLELILTGRGATKGIIGKADLVSKIDEMKHPYNAGLRRREGIEY